MSKFNQFFVQALFSICHPIVRAALLPRPLGPRRPTVIMPTPTTIGALVVIAATVAVNLSAVTAFAPSASSSNPAPSSFLRATNTGIVSVTDENIDEILCGPRPVLVDAFAPWCGPCKLLIKVLRKLQPSYDGRVDFVRWNVDDKTNTRLKRLFVDSGYTLTKLPSLVVFRDGKPIATRDGFANEYQIDSFLERSLPDYLPRTFDDDGVKISSPVVEEISPALDEMAGAMRTIFEESIQEKKPGYLLDTVAGAMSTRTRSMRAERILWQNRTVLPAMEGILFT